MCEAPSRLLRRRRRCKREEFVEAVLAVCARDGLEAVTARGLARELHCSPMVLYRHFDSMDDVVAEAWRAVIELLDRTVWLDNGQASDPIEELERVIRGVSAFARDHPPLLRHLLRAPAGMRSPAVIAPIAAHFDRLRDLISRGVARGAFRPDLDVPRESMQLAFLLIGLATLTCSPNRDALAGCSPEQLLDGTIRRALAGLLPRA